MEVFSYVPAAQRFAADVDAVIASLRAHGLLDGPAYRLLWQAASHFAHLLEVMATHEQILRELAAGLSPARSSEEVAAYSAKMRAQLNDTALLLRGTVIAAATQLGHTFPADSAPDEAKDEHVPSGQRPPRWLM